MLFPTLHQFVYFLIGATFIAIGLSLVILRAIGLQFLLRAFVTRKLFGRFSNERSDDPDVSKTER